MKTVTDLGKIIKRKPQYIGKYDHLDDAEVGRRVKKAYPGSYKHYVDVANDVENQALERISNYKPNGIVRSRFTSIRLEFQIERLKKEYEYIDEMLRLSDQADAIKERRYNREVWAEQKVRENELSALQHKIKMAQGLVLLQTIQDAAEQGLDVDSYREINKISAQHKEEIAYRSELDGLELNKDDKSIQQKVLAATRYHLMENSEILLLIDEAIERYAQLNEIKKSDQPASVKKKQINLLSEHITSLEAQIDGRQDRLVQTVRGSVGRGSNEGPDLGGDLLKNVKEGKGE